MEKKVQFGNEVKKKQNQEEFANNLLSLTHTGNRYKQYRALYYFDPSVELAEYELPLGHMPTGLKNTLHLPPIEPEKKSKRKLQQNREVRETLFIESGTPIFEELQRITTGEDAIQFFAKNGSTTPVKFLLCNKTPQVGSNFRPYDLHVVNENELDNEYYTISAQGVVHVCPSVKFQESDGEYKGTQTEFYSLADWMHQSTMFNLLMQMKFFKHYLATKIFNQ